MLLNTLLNRWIELYPTREAISVMDRLVRYSSLTACWIRRWVCYWIGEMLYICLNRRLI